eukprot:555327-Rhodomonas_salina.1
MSTSKKKRTQRMVLRVSCAIRRTVMASYCIAVPKPTRQMTYHGVFDVLRRLAYADRAGSAVCDAHLQTAPENPGRVRYGPTRASLLHCKLEYKKPHS